MKIGIIGTRGIPNHYGGFEQLAEYLSVGLVAKGHSLTVYNSSLHPYKDKQYKGVNLIHCKDPENKIGTAGQFIYDLNCIWNCRKQNFDVILQLGYTSSSIWGFLFPKKTKVITNMDGLEWKRSKYNSLTKQFLKLAEKWAAQRSDALIADSKGIQNYLERALNKKSTYIAYGAELVGETNVDVLKSLKLNSHGYYLIIARLEPENNIELIINGYLLSKVSEPLVIIGSTKTKFGKYLKNRFASDTILFKESIYDKSVLDALRQHCKLYFHGHSVGGTNPSLLEAMAARAKIAAHRNEFNETVLQNEALYFSSVNDSSKCILTNANETEWQEKIKANVKKIETIYTWQSIINAYEKLMHETCGN